MPKTTPKQVNKQSDTLTKILEKLKEFELALKLSSNLNRKDVLKIQKQLQKIMQTA